MARPNKERRVRRMPTCRRFIPQPGTDPQQVRLSVEQYEAIRLIDYLGLTQQQAADQMGVSRSALQADYAEGRRKLAMFLVEGRELEIDGGDYVLCPEPASNQKGESIMKLAICYENGLVFQHFGHTKQFKVYEIENGVILSSHVADTNGQGHGALAFLLRELGVDALICGGIGMGARNALAQAGVQLFPGCNGSADANAIAFAQGTLTYDPNAQCADHGHGHHHHPAEGEACGSHGCGGHCH